MTLNEYKTKYEPELDEIWEDSAKYQFQNYNAFVKSMYRKYWANEDNL